MSRHNGKPVYIISLDGELNCELKVVQQEANSNPVARIEALEKETLKAPISKKRSYKARSDIGLLFKELKSKYALDVLETKNVQVIEALIWTAMLTLIVSRRIYNLVRSSSSNPVPKLIFTKIDNYTKVL